MNEIKSPGQKIVRGFFVKDKHLIKSVKALFNMPAPQFKTANPNLTL
jgi:hypothetical protein